MKWASSVNEAYFIFFRALVRFFYPKSVIRTLHHIIHSLFMRSCYVRNVIYSFVVCLEITVSCHDITVLCLDTIVSCHDMKFFK